MRRPNVFVCPVLSVRVKGHARGYRKTYYWAPQSWLRGTWQSLAAALLGRAGGLVHVGEEAVGHALAVLVPGHAVLPPALALVPCLPVHQQHGEVDHVEIGQGVLETWQRSGSQCGGPTPEPQ